MSQPEFDARRLVGVKAERVTNISSTDYPGHYPNEDHAWSLSKFKAVRPLLDRIPGRIVREPRRTEPKSTSQTTV